MEIDNNYLNLNGILPQLKERLHTFTKHLENSANTQFSTIPYKFENLSEEFMREYSNKTEYIQYARAYFSRLAEVKEKIMNQARLKWKSLRVCENILDLKGKEPGVIFGIVYKDMPLKPSILKGMESILGSKKVESFVSDKEDSLVIEDFSGRVHVTKTEGGITPGELITGVVAGAKGRLNDRGLFIIEEIIYPQIESYSLPIYLKPTQNTGIFSMLSSNNNLIAFISGLHFGKVDHSGKLKLARNLFLDLIQRRLVSDSNLERLIKRITRLLIVGNSVYASEDVDLVEKGSYLKAELNSRVYRALIQNFDDYDNYLNLLSNCVECDYMPGTDDISSSYFPANAVNQLMLPISSKNSTVNLVTNPYKFKIDDLLLMGTSGQNVDNIRRYSNIGPNSVDIMNTTLEWGHLSPSAPDTLRTYPTIETDPLIIREIPHVYFAGNQKKFESQLSSYNEVPLRLIAVPDFSITFSFVIMDTLTLEVCEYNIELNN